MSDATTGTPGVLTGTVLSGRYRLEQKLGSGGMSTVYLARDETLERWVAAKVLHREISDQPDQIERFRREARAVAQVSHPNVVAVIDAGEDGGRPYIVFEYVEGETLKQRIDRMGKLPLDEAAAYAIEVGRGLQAAHARRLVHRDVKPQNVLIDAEGRAKVTDFGIARELESDGLTKTGRVLGTTDYVSPEQAMGHECDARSDIYSLGVLLYEMLTGDVPFKAENLVGVAMKHVNERMPERAEAPARGLLGARRGDRALDREEARQALPRHGGDARRPRARARGRGRARRALDRRGDDRARLGPAPAPADHPAPGLDRRHPARPRRDRRGAADRRDRRRRRRSSGGGGGGGGPAVGTEVELVAAQDFDPLGDSDEHAEEVGSGDRRRPGDRAGRPRSTPPIPSSQVAAEQAGRRPDRRCRASRSRARSSRSARPRAAGTRTIYAAADGPPTDARGVGRAGRRGRRTRPSDEPIELDVPEPAALLPDLDHRAHRSPGEYKVEISEVSLTGA